MMALLLALLAATTLASVALAQESVSRNCGDHCSAQIQNPAELEACLRNEFGSFNPVFNGISKVTFPDDDDRIGYDRARKTWRGNSYPAAVIYAQDVADVQKALACAVSNGYRVSVRAHGHNAQGLSTMDGYVVIDLKLTCNPEEFILDRSATGEHILPGSKYIATLTVQAGCTNSAIFHALYTKFSVEDKALAVTGGWPSVGVSGCVLGGCSGDMTPYAGYGVDVLTSADIVLYNGTIVTASEDNEYSDLLWATRGGGGANGIVTSYTFKIIENPSPEPKTTRIMMNLDLLDEAARSSYNKRLQAFMYDSDPAISSLFGGGGLVSPFASYLELAYLGGWQEALSHLRELELLDDSVPLTNDAPTKLVVEFEEKCKGSECVTAYSDLLPETGLYVAESANYAEAWAQISCNGLNDVQGIATSGYLCEDLGVDDEKFCEDVDPIVPGETAIRRLVCPRDIEVESQSYAKELIDAILIKAGDPEAFMNTHGISQAYVDNMAALNLTVPARYLKPVTITGGLLIPKLEDDTFDKIASVAMFIAHFQHGAPQMIDSKTTALAWRDAGIMSSFAGNVAGTDTTLIDTMVGHISDEDPAKVRGYYNNLGPVGTPNWKSLYFGDNYDRLSQIKAKYDPLNIFGKPLAIELPEEDNSCGFTDGNVEPMSAAATTSGVAFGFELKDMGTAFILGVVNIFIQL